MSSLTMILIQHSAIKFASDTKWPVTCDRSVVFFWVFQFPPPIKLMFIR